MTMTVPLRRPPAAVPKLGHVLFLRPSDYRYSNDTDLTFEVVRVRLDLSVYYDGEWVWVEGWDLRNGVRTARQVLIRCAALPDESRAVGYAPVPLPRSA